MTKTSQDNNLNYIHFYEYHIKKLKIQKRNMPHFKGFAMINLLLRTVL